MNMASRKGRALANILAGEGISNQTVLDTIAALPRELFLPLALAHKAYENNALPIGQGQTISQPYTVARMTELLLNKIGPEAKILEIGTGSGYQTAVLASLFSQVCSVERIKSLQFQAKRKLNQLDLHNVKMKHGDGWQGWASKGPFDAIIVTAAAATLPQDLVAQLNEGGRLVIPVGESEQKLLCIDKEQGDIQQQVVEVVKFVPLVAGAIS
ncbi:protein-L-isoaspartate(D-aspartate) O-methyltransferase [Glaciecola sp. 2405UD65-10]|uniref:protein-L-isoaspartate(D-aspartate) O-methyltransferase n=1 Tax=Glaciecola sp. 2405UD65-10 TaxID=3397244 RepID=UPI003B5CED92